MNAVEAAKARRARLLAEVQKIDAWLELAAEFEAESSVAQPSLFTQLKTKIEQNKISTRSRVVSAVSDHLIVHGPTSAKDLLAVLMSKGIDPSPASKLDKVNNLSSMLSGEPGFINDRAAKQWRLAEKTEPQDGNPGVQ